MVVHAQMTRHKTSPIDAIIQYSGSPTEGPHEMYDLKWSTNWNQHKKLQKTGYTHIEYRWNLYRGPSVVAFFRTSHYWKHRHWSIAESHIVNKWRACGAGMFGYAWHAIRLNKSCQSNCTTTRYVLFLRNMFWGESHQHRNVYNTLLSIHNLLDEVPSSHLI